ncbi:phage antirepressor KilAC domain-containing protein, partial [Escherichia coli]|nr:phage antirepressor KilAC domain-containing protein [Escherichia coli]
WTLWLPVHAVAVELRELALTLRLISFVIVDYFTVKEVVLDDEDGYQIRLTPQLTGKGQQWLTRKLLDAGLLKPVAAE